MSVAVHFPSRIHALFYVIALLLVAGCSSGPDTTDSLPNYDLLGACERPEDGRYAYLFENAYCGTIQVNEDRTRDDGRKIDLNVMILPASGAVRRPDPVFYLAGGPGQAADEQLVAHLGLSCLARGEMSLRGAPLFRTSPPWATA